MPETVTIEGLAKDIQDLSKKMGTEFASKADVELLTKKVAEFQALKNKPERRGKSHPNFGTQGNFELVAGIIGKGLFAAGHLQESDCTSSDASRKNAALQWKQAAAGLNSTDTGVGAEFLPVTIDPVISKLVNDYGVARRICRTIPGVHGTRQIKRRNTRVNVSGMPTGRPDDAAPLGNSTYDGVSLKTSQVSAITTIEEYLIYNSVPDVVMEAMEDLAEAAANFDDDTLFNGTGTAAYLNFTGVSKASGLVNALDGSAGLGDLTISIGGSQVLNFDTMLAMQTKVHPSVIRRGDARYTMHPYTFAYLQTLKASTSGLYFYDISKNNFIVGGYPIEFAVVEDAGAGAIAQPFAAGQVPVTFGDYKRGIAMGFGREMELRVLTERYADTNEIGIRLTYDEGFCYVQPSCICRARFIA